jgi:hypothetical protein
MIDDEFHYLFICQCKEVVEIRNKFITNYYTNNPNENKIIGFFNLIIENNKNNYNQLHITNVG